MGPDTERVRKFEHMLVFGRGSSFWHYAITQLPDTVQKQGYRLATMDSPHGKRRAFPTPAQRMCIKLSNGLGISTVGSNSQGVPSTQSPSLEVSVRLSNLRLIEAAKKSGATFLVINCGMTRADSLADSKLEVLAGEALMRLACQPSFLVNRPCSLS